MKENHSYITFLRSATNWREFASADKIIQETGLTYQEAYDACQEFAKNRTEEQIENGTKLEFTCDLDYLSDAVNEDGEPFFNH